MSKHTKGPWKWVKCPDVKSFTVYSKDVSSIASVKNYGDEFTAMCESNARLIAAAPELLEKVKVYFGACKSCDVENEEPCSLCADTAELIKRAEGGGK